MAKEFRIPSHFLSLGLASKDVLFTFQDCGENKHHDVRAFHQWDTNTAMLGLRQDAEQNTVFIFILSSFLRTFPVLYVSALSHRDTRRRLLVSQSM